MTVLVINVETIGIIYEHWWNTRARFGTCSSFLEEEENPCPGNYILEKFSYKLNIAWNSGSPPSFSMLWHTWKKAQPLHGDIISWAPPRLLATSQQKAQLWWHTILWALEFKIAHKKVKRALFWYFWID